MTNTIIKFAGDTTVVGLITGGGKFAYRRKGQRLNLDFKWRNLD